MAEFDISKIKNDALRSVAKAVDKLSNDSKTKNNGKIDGNELSVFFDSASDIMQNDKSAAEEVTALLQGKEYKKENKPKESKPTENKGTASKSSSKNYYNQNYINTEVTDYEATHYKSCRTFDKHFSNGDRQIVKMCTPYHRSLLNNEEVRESIKLDRNGKVIYYFKKDDDED